MLGYLIFQYGGIYYRFVTIWQLTQRSWFYGMVSPKSLLINVFVFYIFFIDHDYYYLYRNCVIRYACGCTFYWIFYTLRSRPENFLDQDQKESLVRFGLNNLCPWPSYGLCQVISLWLDLGCVTHRYSSCLHLLPCVTSECYIHLRVLYIALV